MTCGKIVYLIRTALLCAGIFFCLHASAQDIAINEILASNTSVIADQDGDYPDWIELYNYGSEVADLEGYGLSDNPDNPFRWVFPAVLLAPGEYLLVWASGKDRKPEGGWVNGMLREVYSGITGTAIADMVSHPSYPDNPSSKKLVTTGFIAPVNIDNHYGQRMQGYIEAPATGDYVFWISSDDEGRLYLSTDEDPGNMIQIASVPGWTNPGEWNKYPEQQSQPVVLEEGKKYYIMALMKEHEGGDNLTVRWRLPSGTIEDPIPNNRLYWNETELHTNFAINREGEEILLTSRDSVRIDEIPPTELQANISYGKYPNGTGELYYYTEPTPGEANHGGGLAVLPALPGPPVFSPEGGPYTSPFQLEISCDAGLEIYYTTNGTEPKPGTGLKYTGPFNISGTTLVKAIAREPGGASSKVASAVYTQLSYSSNLFSSDLPLMVIHTFNTPITEGDRTPAYISLMDKGADGRARLSSDPVLQGRILINIRGSSTTMFPKKMFGFHLVEENGDNRKEPLLDMPAEHNWILNGPYSDKTLMRNVVAYSLSNDIGRYAPRTRFIELYLHGGNGSLEDASYHGVYVLTERIKWSEGRVDITRMDPRDNEEPEITGGYIIKKDRFNPGESGLRTQRGTNLAFVRPQESEISPQQKAWIENYLSRFESALFGAQFTDPKEGYAKYIDPDSFIDAHLITELLKEIDGYRLSTFMHKDRGGKLTMGPLWDFNLSIGNADYLEGWKPAGWYYDLISESEYLNGWYTRLFADPEFSDRYVERWWQLRRGPFKNDSLRRRINLNAFVLTEAKERNFVRWPILNTYVWPNGYVGPTYNHEVAWMTDWLTSRTKWMDYQFGDSTSLVHYWHFNELPANDFYDVTAGYTTQNALLVYEGSGEGYMDRVNDGTLLNADLGMPAGDALRVRNPSGTRELRFSLPTRGYRDVVFRYAVKRTPNGARKQTVYYRIREMEEWIPCSDTLEITETCQQFRFSFASAEETDDNDQFAVRILFHGPESAGTEGNNRFDNITLEGYSLYQEGEDPYPEVEAWHAHAHLHVENPLDGRAQIEVFDMSGRLAGRFEAYGRGWHEFWFAPPTGIYIVRVINGGYVYRAKLFIRAMDR